jgi:hypothetical protein
VFGDSVIAAGILDCLRHHSITVVKGKSYRPRENLEAGLLKPSSAATTAVTPAPSTG